MAATTTIRINLPEARAVAQTLLTVRTNEIEAAIGVLRQLNQKLDAAWDGPASIDFNTMFEQWNTFLGRVADDLHQVNKYIVDAAKSYEDTDSQQKQDVNRLRAETHLN
ncbi:MAG: WXG100 family type VII secretion target [Anaerolineales bacterium]|nr:WXG100 family type VII secretion target [Anaerolineales bacterium]